MNLNTLDAFLHLSESLSSTATARSLGLTQPSVSRQIKLLEEELKTQLFIRDRHADCLAVLPYFTVHRLLERKELRLASDKETRNALYLVFLESQLHSRKNTVFRKFLQERCKNSKLG